MSGIKDDLCGTEGVKRGQFEPAMSDQITKLHSHFGLVHTPTLRRWSVVVGGSATNLKMRAEFVFSLANRCSTGSLSIQACGSGQTKRKIT